MRRLVFAGNRVLLPDGLASAQVCVENGRIVAIDALGSALPRGAAIVELRNYVLLPGLVDTHVHINEPGRTHWEGFVSATRAAAAGGVTTLLDMPLNCVPATTTAAALAVKRAAAAGQLHVDVGFIGGIVPGNVADLKGLYDEGVFAWKCFLSDSGVEEFPRIDPSSLRPVLARIAEWQLPLMVHAEIPELLVPAPAGAVRRYADYAATRPADAELAAVRHMAELGAAAGVPVHIVHVSSAEGIGALATARAGGVAITGETCPHYLTFAAEEIPDAATEFKCAPPIRSGVQREGLWTARVNGQLSVVVSDHSPAPPALKHRENGDLVAAWGGIASLELGLAALWAGAERRGIAFSDIVAWMSARPAELVRLARKGSIAVGCDADLVIWHPEARRKVDAAKLRQRHPMTPYHGLTLAGEVQATYLRGQLIYEQGVFAPSAGRLLHRARA